MSGARQTVRHVAASAVLGVLGALLWVAPGSAQVPPGGIGIDDAPRILVFSGTYGFRHAAIPKSNVILATMGASTGAYTVDVTENPLDISAANLQDYDAVVFNSTAGKTPLTAQQREDLVRFVGCGGGFVGVAMAPDSNYAWPEYTELIGANVVNHPLTEGHTPATRIVVDDAEHPITADAFAPGDDLMTQEELYLWRMDPRRLPGTHTLLSIDISTVDESIQDGPDAFPEGAPAAWTSTFRGGGRTFTNGFGHGDLSWDQVWFRSMMHEGLEWVTGTPVDRACAAGDEPLPPPAGPPAADPDTVGEPCPMPTSGTYLAGTQRLTAEGVTELMPVGVPAYIFAPNNRYVVDLSEVGAASADLDLVLDWTGPADYDLGVTLPWGFAGSSLTQPRDGVSGERVVIEDVPHCADILVAAENGWSGGLFAEQLRPTLTIAVTPDPV